MARPCPVCGKEVPEDPRPACYPFCSPRCAKIDLGGWLSNRYAISEELPDSEGAGAAAEEEPE